MRIGIIGTENSHADHFVRHFNTEQRYPGHRVVALAGGRNERNTALAAAGEITEIVADPTDLLGRIDAGIVCSRDGAQHRAEAEPLLAAGLPVLVDKPLACSVPDAQALLARAAEHGGPLSSYSALRFAPQTTALAERLGAGDPPDLLAVSGPADPTSPYSGIFFYGVHIVEIALRLLDGTDVTDVEVVEHDDAVLATGRCGPTRLLLEFVKPGTRTEIPWRVVATGPAGMTAEVIRLGEHYARPGVDVFAQMLESGQPPLSEAQLLAPVRVLSTVAAALQ